MRILVEQSVLQKATARVASAAARGGEIIILNNLLIDATPVGVWLVATDLAIEVRARIQADVQVEGQVTVNAADLGEIARNAPKGAEIALELDVDADPRLQVRFGRSRYKMPALPGEDFPEFPAMEGATSITITSAELGQVLDRVHFAQSSDETRYYLNGVFLEKVSVAGEPVLRAVATDGLRLAVDECPAPTGEPMTSVIIPRKSVIELRRLIGDHTGPVTVSTSKAAIAVEAGEVRMISKVVEGSYPDYLRVIPQKWDREITFDRELLAAAVKRASIIGSEKARRVKLTIDEGLLTLAVRNTESGEATEQIEIEDDGGFFEASFTARHVLDALDQSDGSRVVFRFTDNASPTRLEPHPSDSAGSGTLCVLSPLRA